VKLCFFTTSENFACQKKVRKKWLEWLSIPKKNGAKKKCCEKKWRSSKICKSFSMCPHVLL